MSIAVPVTRSRRRVDIAAAPGQTVFNFDFALFDQLDLAVFRMVSPATSFTRITTGYTVAIATGNMSATVTFAVAPRPTAGDPAVVIRLKGQRTGERLSDVTRDGVLRAAALERDLDRLYLQGNELRGDIDDALTATGLSGVPAFELSTSITPPVITATQNNYAPSGFAAAVWRLAGDAPRVITGMVPATLDGAVRLLVNIGAHSLLLTNEDGASLAINRFSLGGLVAIPPGGYVMCRYDGTLSRWQVHQQFRLATDPISPAQITATQNDYAPTGGGSSSRWRLATDAARDITGMIAGFDGQLRIIENAGANPIGFVPESGASLAANRIAGALSVTLNPGTWMAFCYDGTAARWRPQGGASGAGANVVLYDPQSLTANQARTVRQNISAASFDAGAALGLLLNPANEISQERGTSSVTVGPSAGGVTTYVTDQWTVQARGTMAVSAQQIANPFAVDGFRRLQNALRVTVSTAQASLGANDGLCIEQPIEGTFLASLGLGGNDARALDVPVIVSAGQACTGTVYFQNAARDRSWNTSFTLAANTPTLVWVPIGALTAGTWVTGNAVAGYIGIALGAGSSLQTATLDQWTNTNSRGHASTTNFSATLSATFTLAFAQVFPTGVLPFTSAAQAAGEKLAQLIGTRRPLDDEIRRCRRYFEPVGASVRGYSAGSGQTIETTVFYTEKMVVPSFTALTGNISVNISGAVFTSPSRTSSRFTITSAGAGDTASLNGTSNIGSRM